MKIPSHIHSHMHIRYFSEKFTIISCSFRSISIFWGAEKKIISKRIWKNTKIYQDTFIGVYWLYKKFRRQRTNRTSPSLHIISVHSQQSLNFFGDLLGCEQHTWQLVQNHLNFFPQTPHMISWHLVKFHNFRTSFAFNRILKLLGHMVELVFPEQDVRNFFWFHGYGLNLRWVPWISIFHSTFSYIGMICSSNLTWFKKLLKIKLII